MASRWQTSVIPFEGGLVLDKPSLRLSAEQPGSAIYLENLVPDLRLRGYSKVLGYSKFSGDEVPDNSDPLSKVVGVYTLVDGSVLAFRSKKVYHSSGSAWSTLNATDLPLTSIKVRGVTYNFVGTNKSIFVDSANKPFIIDNTTRSFTILSSAPSDTEGASCVASFAGRLFFGKQNLLSYTAPNTDDDFSVAAGAGVINTGDEIVALKVFKGSLLVFLKHSIKALSGDTTANFKLETLTESNWCVSGDTIQEVENDIVYLSQSGVRVLSDTQNNSLFQAINVAASVNPLVVSLLKQYTQFSSCVIPSKNEYRLFFYSDSLDKGLATGLVGVQFGGQGDNSFEWSTLKGFQCFSCHSNSILGSDRVVFSSSDSFIYSMESGKSFSGEPISWAFHTPFMFFSDPTLRKTIHKVHFFGSFSNVQDLTLSVRLDFNEAKFIQPSPILTSISNLGASGSIFGASVFGAATFGSSSIQRFSAQAVGAGEHFSFQLYGSGLDEEFNFNTLVLELSQQDRQ